MAEPAAGRSLLGVGLKLALLVALLVAASQVGGWLESQLNLHLTPSTEPALHRTIMTAMAVYVLLMMLPFVPGAEIGLGLLVMFGPKIAPLVYAGTVLALMLAFLLGRLVPQRAIVEIFEALRPRRAASLLRRLVPFLLRHRFIALALSSTFRATPLSAAAAGSAWSPGSAGCSHCRPMH
jgi:uncharacterized membrane protein YdjX (TVP38/TMEM64 family)